MIVVIDGPAGSGKSSTAKAVAEALNIQFLDSGALYRAAALIYIKADENQKQFFELLNKSEISFFYAHNIFQVLIDGNTVTDQIRSAEVSSKVSVVAAMPEVRSFVNQLMHHAVKSGVYIADGRDLGTAVFPNAELKFFMTADLEKRALRRQKEMEEKGERVSLEEVKHNLSYRDDLDSSRKADPLKKADDAISVDTSEFTFPDQVAFIVNTIQKKLKLD